MNASERGLSVDKLETVDIAMWETMCEKKSKNEFYVHSDAFRIVVAGQGLGLSGLSTSRTSNKKYDDGSIIIIITHHTTAAR